MFNLLDPHDTERILWTANEDVQLIKSALTFLFYKRNTLYLLRNRVILNWRDDPDCRRCMPWEQVSSDHDMLNLKKLIEIRKHASVIISAWQV